MPHGRKFRAVMFGLLLTVLLVSWLLPSTSARVESVKFDKVSYEPGETGTCTVKFVNIFDTKMKVIKVELRTDFSNYSWTGELILKIGASEALNVSFTVPKDTKPGAYQFSVYFEFMVLHGNKWAKMGPGGYGPSGETIKVTQQMILGFPFEGILVGLALGIAILGIVILATRRTRRTIGQ